MEGHDPGRLSPREQAELYSAEEIPKKGAHDRRKDLILLGAGISFSFLLAIVAVVLLLDSGVSQELKLLAAGWIGVILGQVKKVWGD